MTLIAKADCECMLANIFSYGRCKSVDSSLLLAEVGNLHC